MCVTFLVLTQTLLRVRHDGIDTRAILRALRAIDASAADTLLEHVVLTGGAQAAALHEELFDTLVGVLSRCAYFPTAASLSGT